MANICETCEDLKKYKYWHDLQNIKHQFFKIMLGDFEHHLRIPRHFIGCFMGDLSHSSVLKGPSGNEWEVQIIKTKEDVLFSNGWEKFVKDHGIKEGCFLVFRSLLHLENDEGCSQTTKFAATKLSESKLMKKKLDISSDEEMEMGDRPSRRSRRTSQGKQSQMHYISKRREVTEEEKDHAKDMARNHNKSSSKSSRKRMFEIVMRPTHVYDGFHLTIPKEWALEHMHPKDHEVKLRVPGGKEESWVVGCRWTSQRQCQIRPRWSTFVLDNNLEEHDVCVFELLQKGESGKNRLPIFDVHIFRVVSEVVPLTVLRA
ncbi:hypothetical protein SOVF_170880 [Spinacia oleracea]|uniref:B3 domain-containing protein REM16 isoform X2 n=1 Tax=Spinacia oleracea TaxID=3562 RepID=A0ABM3RTA3_SPIOL|nr:B3 domain-containing protein REM16-like isoform X2 [Spinacia oleracea]KNA07511.1 hypothetical protein SOVF_170880 [Spinacia oleracea]